MLYVYTSRYLVLAVIFHSDPEQPSLYIPISIPSLQEGGRTGRRSWLHEPLWARAPAPLHELLVELVGLVVVAVAVAVAYLYI